MNKTDFHSDYKNCKADICKVSRIIRIKIRSLIAVMMHSVNPQMSNVYGSIKSCRKTSQNNLSQHYALSRQILSTTTALRLTNTAYLFFLYPYSYCQWMSSGLRSLCECWTNNSFFLHINFKKTSQG